MTTKYKILKTIKEVKSDKNSDIMQKSRYRKIKGIGLTYGFPDKQREMLVKDCCELEDILDLPILIEHGTRDVIGRWTTAREVEFESNNRKYEGVEVEGFVLDDPNIREAIKDKNYLSIGGRYIEKEAFPGNNITGLRKVKLSEISVVKKPAVVMNNVMQKNYEENDIEEQDIGGFVIEEIEVNNTEHSTIDENESSKNDNQFTKSDVSVEGSNFELNEYLKVLSQIVEKIDKIESRLFAQEQEKNKAQTDTIDAQTDANKAESPTKEEVISNDAIAEGSVKENEENKPVLENASNNPPASNTENPEGKQSVISPESFTDMQAKMLKNLDNLKKIKKLLTNEK